MQARILEWAAILYPRDLPDPGIESASPASPAPPALAADSLPLSHQGTPTTAGYTGGTVTDQASTEVTRSGKKFESLCLVELWTTGTDTQLEFEEPESGFPHYWKRNNDGSDTPEHPTVLTVVWGPGWQKCLCAFLG